MKCSLNNYKHTKFKSLGRDFVEFWNKYFQSTAIRVRELPIKYFLSAVDLVNLCELSECCCENLLEKLFPDSNRYSCNDCQKRFATKSALQLHEMKHNRALKKPRFECVFCQKNLKSKFALLRHTELHTKEYKCEVCDQVLHHKDCLRHSETTKHQTRIKTPTQTSIKSIKKKKMNDPRI